LPARGAEEAPVAAVGLAEKVKLANVSPFAKELVKMSEAGTDAAIIQAYVETSTAAYRPKADDIIYLHEHGISGTIITALIQRGGKVQEPAVVVQAPQPAP